MVRSDLLPGEQEANEVGGCDRLDLLPQSIQCVTVNSSEQATRTPLSFRCARRELATNHKPFGFESQQSSFDFQLVQAGRRQRAVRLLLVQDLQGVRE